MLVVRVGFVILILRYTYSRNKIISIHKLCYKILTCIKGIHFIFSTHW